MIDDRYFPGILEAIWFSVVTMSTVGYGDIAPQKWIGKLTALSIILLGVAAFGIIVGEFAADAVQPAASKPVENVHDLRKYRIGTKADTATTEFLDAQGMDYESYEDLDGALRSLESREIDIVVHDSIAINYEASKSDDLIVTGPSFNQHYLAFALPPGSPLKEPVNRAILELRENGRYSTIWKRWFGED